MARCRPCELDGISPAQHTGRAAMGPRLFARYAANHPGGVVAPTDLRGGADALAAMNVSNVLAAGLGGALGFAALYFWKTRRR